jgi:hypothetical protein
MPQAKRIEHDVSTMTFQSWFPKRHQLVYRNEQLVGSGQPRPIVSLCHVPLSLNLQFLLKLAIMVSFCRAELAAILRILRYLR